MTQSEFIKNYCENSKLREKELNNLQQFAIPCNCMRENCEGWAMIKKDKKGIINHATLYIHDDVFFKNKINKII